MCDYILIYRSICYGRFVNSAGMYTGRPVCIPDVYTALLHFGNSFNFAATHDRPRESNKYTWRIIISPRTISPDRIIRWT